MDTHTTYHRDNTVTYWDVYAQTWQRRVPAAAILTDSRTMSTLSETERRRITRMARRAEHTDRMY